MRVKLNGCRMEVHKKEWQKNDKKNAERTKGKKGEVRNVMKERISGEKTRIT